MPISSSKAPRFPGMQLVAWAFVTAAGTLVKGSNLTSARVIAGQYTLTFGTAQADTNYLVHVTSNAGSGNGFNGAVVSKATGSTSVYVLNLANGLIDGDFYAEVWR